MSSLWVLDTIILETREASWSKVVVESPQNQVGEVLMVENAEVPVEGYEVLMMEGRPQEELQKSAQVAGALHFWSSQLST